MKSSILLFFMSIFVISPGYSQCIGDCANGAGKKIYSSGTYVGFFKNNLREGHGTFTFSNGEKYDGEWKNDRPTNGKYMWNGGEVWNGDVWLKLNNESFNSNLAPKGVGILTLTNGEKYQMSYYSNTYTSFLINGGFKWFYPQTCFKIGPSGELIEGEWIDDEGFVSMVVLQNRQKLARLERAKAAYNEEVESIELALRNSNSIEWSNYSIEVKSFIVNDNSLGLVTTRGTRGTGALIDFSNYSLNIKSNYNETPGFIIVDGIPYYNRAAVEKIIRQINAENWEIISKVKYEDYCNELNSAGDICSWCNGKRKLDAIISYDWCGVCSYWTDEQRKFNPCSNCRNTRRVNVRWGKELCWKCEGTGKKFDDYSFRESLPEALISLEPIHLWCLNEYSDFSITEINKKDESKEIVSDLNNYMFFPLLVQKKI